MVRINKNNLQLCRDHLESKTCFYRGNINKWRRHQFTDITCGVTWKPQKVSADLAHSVAVTSFLNDADASMILSSPFTFLGSSFLCAFCRLFLTVIGLWT